MKRTAAILLVILLTLFATRPSVLAQTVPFHEGFDDGVLPSGWTMIDSDGDGYCWDVLSGPSYGHSGDGLIISGSYNGVNNWLVSPAITIPQNAILSFWIRGINADYAAEEYSVYVATSNIDTAFISTVPVLTDTTISVWEQKLIDLSLYAGQTVYIAFRHHNTTDMYYLGLDEVEVTSCPRATSLSIEDISGTTATVTWQHNGLNEPDHYELSYKVENDSTWVIVSPIHSNNYLLDNLSPTTGYMVRIRVFCDDTTTSDYIENSFITDCVCCPPSSLEVNDISGTAAMVTWQSIGSNDPDHYELSYKVEDDSAWTIVSPIYTNYYLLTNLSPTTKYNVKVRLFCDDTTSSNWLERTFRTECLDGTSDLIIGKTNTSNQGNYFPVGFDNNYSYTQQIYHGDEIGEARSINAIDIQYFYSTPESRTVDIYLGHTQQSGFTSGYDWVPNSDLTLVYSGSVMFDNTGDNFWCHIPFTTTFEYNGVDNLVLAFYDKTGSSYNSWYERCYTHSTPTSFSKWVSSYEALDLANISFHYGYIPSYRNNIRFPGICVNNACERPLVSAVNITDSSAQLTVSSANSADGFELEYRQEGNDVYSAISATSTSILLTGLRQNTQYDVRVRSICGGNYSSWKKTTFTTGAGNHNRLYVTASGTGDGTSWTDAANDLQWALNTAQVIKNTYSTTPEIWVAAGTYYGDTTDGSTYAFTMVEGVNVYGGFAGDEPVNYDITQRDFATNASILDGQSVIGVLFQPSSFTVSTLWDGFTIQHGQVDSYIAGGGVLLRRNGCLSHCIVKNNYAGSGGGIYANYSTISNCLVSNNTAANTGGGIHAWYSTITNTTIVRNTSSYEGAGFWGDQETQFMNNIVWGNGTSPSKNVAGDFVCSYSAIEGGYQGQHNIILGEQFNQHPMFVQPTLTSGADDTSIGDWHLQQGSICINHGNNTAIVDSLDLDGTARIKRDTVDLGCYESDFYGVPLVQPDYSNIIYVTQNGFGNQTGENWANATSSIAVAMEMAHTYNADVWVAAGTYYGDTTATSENAFTMVEGVNVYGGFAGNEPADFDLSQRDFETNATILDGQNARRVLNQPSWFNTETTWDGFTIQRGSGGGAYITQNGKLSHSIIRNNNGRGLYAGYNSTVSSCQILNNSTTGWGGGIYADGATVTNCLVKNNASSGNGGGVCASGSSIISNSLISNNTASSNEALYGGGVFVYGNSTIINTTIVRNSAYFGAGIGSWNGNGGNLTNCIVWGNGSTADNNILGNSTCSFSAIEGGWGGNNNIMLSDINPPLFVNPSLTSGASDSTGNVDWHLQEGSPCINVGNNAFVTESFDLDGMARIKRDTVDLGCYESNYYSSPINGPEYAGIVYVTQEGAGAQTGEDWDNAISSISNALSIARAYNADVWVAAGTYYGDTTATSENAFTMLNGVNVYGGFAGNEPADFDLSLRDFETNATILDGQNTRRVLNSTSFNTPTSWDGFTIQNGASTWNGGGAYLSNNGKLSHCIIKNNTAGYAGGGIFAENNTTVSNCYITSNTGHLGGGVSGVSIISNCLITNNTASNSGGGVYCSSSSIINSTIVRNTANSGAGIYGDFGYNETETNSTIKNCIVWGNGLTAINNIAGNITCYFSAIEGGCAGEHNILLGEQSNQNPLFVQPTQTSGVSDTSVGDWHLQQGSVCVNNGQNAAVIDSVDLDGTTRIKQDTVDMGCYESDFYSVPLVQTNYSNIIYVTQEGAGNQTGENWANATSSISDAIAIARSNNATVWVASGIYYGDTATTSKNSFTMVDSVNVYGGFAGNEPADFDLSLRDFETNASILDGQNVRRVLYRPNWLNTSTTWDGFTIQNGLSENYGGGVLLHGNGELSHCVIKNNSANYGGGVCLYGAVVTNCLISNNTANYGGGVNAMFNSTISSCHISSNTAGDDGGGVSSFATIISNCLISNNTANDNGGGVIANGNSIITNSTIVRNADLDHITDGVCSVYGYDTVINCIIWGNGNNASDNISGNVTCTYSAIEGGYSGENNIALSDVNPPLFVNPSLTSGVPDSTENVDWHLQEGSPCINVGNNAFVTESIDLDGTTRIKNDVVDLGCYESEYGGNTPCTGVVSEFWHSACDSYTWNNQIYTQSGDYEQAFALENGCDSVVTLHLTITNTDHTDFTDVVCESYTWNGETYTESGTYSQTFTNSVGCDSVVTLHLTITNTDHTDFTDVACESYTWNGETYTESGTYSQTFTNSAGCDSIVTLYLTVNNATTGIDEQTACESFTWINGVTYTESTNTPTFTLTNAAGCDSIVTLHLTINSAYHEYLHVSACEEYVWNGETYLASGDYNQTFTAANGCDSIVTLHLTINNPVHTAVTEVACESFFWNDITYTQSGDYTQTFTAANGCDSVVTLHLTITNTDHTDFTDVACESYTWNGETYTESGTYSQTFTNSAGCDSIVTLYLTVNNATTGIDEQTACESFTWINEVTYTESTNTPTFTLTNAAGCDSIVTLNLTINSAYHEYLHVSACEEYVWNGETYSASGDYNQTFTAANGCDSIVTLHLTINNPVHTAVTEVACESFFWNDITYTQSGDYTQTFTAANGCDSVVTLHLTITNTDHTDFTDAACDSYTWNGETYAQSGTYSQTFTNSVGCDSVVTLHLTITNTDHTDFTDEACNSYTWNSETYTQSGDYTQTFTNSAGCDSVVTLHLTINQPTTGDTTAVACESFTWEGETYMQSGDYTSYQTNAAGCDSIVTLHLTVNYPVHTAIAAGSCGSYLWNGNTYNESGDYTFSHEDANGCTQVDTLYLTIFDNETSEFSVECPDSCYTWNAQSYCTSGDYTQTLQTVHGCDSVVTLHLTITVSVDDYDGFDFKVYPNPTSNIVNVQCTMNNVQLGGMELHLCDAYGRLLDVFRANNDSPLRTAQIDLSRYAKGVYFVKAVADGTTAAVRKVVKQ